MEELGKTRGRGRREERNQPEDAESEILVWGATGGAHPYLI